MAVVEQFTPTVDVGVTILVNLLNKPVKRIFTFGCSFTGYAWMTWPEVLGYDLDLPVYNYGRSGAGNQYIFNTLMQALNYYEINKDDLVVVQFTNICREDRYINGRWITPGNIYAHGFYDKDFIQRYCDINGYLLRDSAIISAIDRILQHSECQYHFFAMNNILENFDQYSNEKIKEDKQLESVKTLYYTSISRILPSFYEILWCNDIRVKINKEREMFGKSFRDYHPSPVEHLEFLQKTFNYKFNEKTISAVNNINDTWSIKCKEIANANIAGVYLLPKEKLIEFKSSCCLMQNQHLFLL